MRHDDMHLLPSTIKEAIECLNAAIDELRRANAICEDCSVASRPDGSDEIYYQPGYDLAQEILPFQRQLQDLLEEIESLPDLHPLAFARAEADLEIRKDLVDRYSD